MAAAFYMFERLLQVIKNVQALESNDIAIEIFAGSEVQKYILNLNRINQLYLNGVDSEGTQIGTYSYVTDVLRSGETFNYEGYTSTKQQGEHFTLFDTGEFYKSFQVVLTENGFIIEADDRKENEYLSDKYGLEILGLSNDSKNDLARQIIQKVIELVKRKILS